MRYESGRNEAGIHEPTAIERGTLRRLLVVPAVAVAIFLVAGCNTVEGVGKDVQAAGEGIEDAADDD